MAKFRPRGGGSRLPSRSGGSTGQQLKSSVDGVTAALQTQRQAWTEVIGSLNEYRSIELPDFDQSIPDVAGWQTLTAEVKAYSAAIAAIPTVENASPAVAVSQSQAASEAPTDSREIITATTAAIDEQSKAWTELAASTTAAAESTAASAAAMQELLTSAAQTKSGVESVNGEIASGTPASREQLQQIITTINTEDQSWRSLAVTTVGSLGRVATSIISLVAASRTLATAQLTTRTAQIQLATATIAGAGANTAAIVPTFTLAAAVNFLLSPIVLVTAAIAAVAAAFYVLTSSEEDATASTTDTANAADSAASSYSLWDETTQKLGISTASLTKELDAVAIQKQSLAGPLLDEETISSLGKLITGVGEVKSSYENLKATIEQPFIDAKNAMVSYGMSLLGIQENADSATSLLKPVADAIDEVAASTKGGINSLEAWLYQLRTGASDEEAAAFVKQGEAMTTLAARTAAATASMEAQRDAFKRLAQTQQESTDSAKQATETARIGRIATIAEIEKEERALQQKAGAEIRAGQAAVEALTKRGATEKEIEAQRKSNRSQESKTGEQIKTVANQREKIETGQVETGVDAATRQTTEAIRALTLSQTENSIATMRAKAIREGTLASFEAGLPAYRAEQEALAAVKEAIEQTKKTQDELAASMRKVEDANKSAAEHIETVKDKIAVLNGSMTEADVAMKAMNKNGINPELATETARVTAEFSKLTIATKAADKITSIKDQIDLLNGSATQAEIAMRELTRQGFSQEQVAEIGALTGELDRLKDSKKTNDGKDKAPTAFSGSKEAAQIALRGVGGGNRMETIANQQLQVQREIARGVNRPPVAPIGVPPLPAPSELADGGATVSSPSGPRPLSLVPPPLVPPRTPAPSPPDVRAGAPVLIPERAGLTEAPKISGVSDRVTESRRNNRDNEMVDLLRSLLQEEKLNTAAVKDIEMPAMQVGVV